MILNMNSFFLTICCALCSAFALDLPSYIPQCSLSEPKLNECILEKANIVIPTLVEGDDILEISVLSPAHISNGKLEGNNLVVEVTDMLYHNLGNVILTDALFDIKAKKGGFKANLDILTITGEYSINNGQVEMHSVSGSGRMNITLVGNQLIYKNNVRGIDRDGERYIDVSNSTVDLITSRAYYFFENLQSSEEDEDVNKFIDRNWRIVQDDLELSIESYLLKFIQLAIDAVIDKIPLKKIFLP